MHDMVTAPLAAKLISGLGGLIGGASFMAFYKPTNVWDAAIRSGLSVTAAIVSTPVLIDHYNLNHDMNYIVAVSFAAGFCAWSVLSLLARSLIKIQDEKVNIKIPGVSIRK